MTALLGARLFTGACYLERHALMIDGDRIAGIVAEQDVPAHEDTRHLDGGLLAPGFIDAQVNGGGDVLFNATPDPAALDRLAKAHARHGTTALLPTFITDRPERMALAIEAAETASVHNHAIAGLHLEGPFLSIARKGAHDPALIRRMQAADLERLLDCRLRPLLVTVAPESVTNAQIARLADAGITVSLGHSDTDYDTAMNAARAGATAITHLFNAMSPLGHRAPGLVGAALDHPDLWCGIIADGHHVHPAVLASALRAKRGPARLFLVSDAMPSAAGGGDRFELNGRTVTRRDGRLTLADGTLAGSDLTMAAALAYTVAELGVPLEEALRMTSLYPATVLGLDRERGRLAPGLRADLVHLDDALSVRGVWIGGAPLEASAVDQDMPHERT